MPPERSTVDRASALSPFYLGQPAHPSRGQKKYPSVALDRAGITVFRDITFFAAGPASETSPAALPRHHEKEPDRIGQRSETAEGVPRKVGAPASGIGCTSKHACPDAPAQRPHSRYLGPGSSLQRHF